MIFVLDNFDSFTYNLVHLLYEFESDIKVCRNRSITVEEVITLAPEAIILSPGPGRPKTAGIMPQLIEKAVSKQIPMPEADAQHGGMVGKEAPPGNSHKIGAAVFFYGGNEAKGAGCGQALCLAMHDFFHL